MNDPNPSLRLARQIKHRAFLARRQVILRVTQARDSQWRRTALRTDFEFDLDRYRDHAGFFPFDFFLHRDADHDDVTPDSVVPRIIYSTWTGTNPMSADRSRALQEFCRVNHDVEHRLVTRENLDEILVKDAPLHPAFDLLSDVHKSDYLRCYLMHFRGGGYTDVKGATASWRDAFGAFDDPEAWVVGYPESSSQIADNLHDPLRHDIKRNFARLMGNCAFIARARTPFTSEWYAEVTRRLDYYYRDLMSHPAQDPFGRNSDYPVTWVGLQGLVFHPLQLKHMDHLRKSDLLTPSFDRFR